MIVQTVVMGVARRANGGGGGGGGARGDDAGRARGWPRTRAGGNRARGAMY